jgi:hypothetical protein
MRTIDRRRWRRGSSGECRAWTRGRRELIAGVTSCALREPKVKKVENPKFKEEEEAVSFIFMFVCYSRGALISVVSLTSSESASPSKSRWRRLDSGNGVRFYLHSPLKYA